MRRALGPDIRWGIARAFRLVVVFAVLAAILWVVNGRHGEAVPGLTLQSVLFAYTAIGLFCGVLAGLVRPWLSTLFGISTFGLIAGAAAGLAIRVVDRGVAAWDAVDAILVVSSSMIGFVGAIAVWRRLAREKL